MRSPFVFGKIATGHAFINRQSELKKLSGNFRNQVNTILISPRRWGKSSLVRETSRLVVNESPSIKVCFLDLFRIRTEEDFYRKYATEVIKATSGKFEDWVRDIKELLGRFSPSFSFGSDPMLDFQLNFNIKTEESTAEEILNLPEKLAEKKNINIIVCIDEFQNIGNYAEPLQFQKILRSVWQYHKHTSYCLYGSKKHMLTELFENQSMPFYKFGELLFIQKIGIDHFIEFITRSFAETGKTIDPLQAEKIVETTDAHPYFVQQLAHITWQNTSDKVSDEIMKASTDELTEQNAMLYQEIINGLSDTQVNLLIAISKKETRLSSSAVMQKYSLGTSANVVKNKKVLVDREIIEVTADNITFQDPVFRIWLNKIFE